MTFSPASSVGGGGGGGNVTVTNFPAVYPVTGALTDAELRAAPVEVLEQGTPQVLATQLTVPWQVQGGLTDAELRAAPVDVLGPLTDAELRAAPVDVTAEALPLPEGAATEATLERAAGALDDVGLTAILEREKIEP